MYVRPGRVICANPIATRKGASKKYLKTFRDSKLIVVPVIMDGDVPRRTNFIENNMYTFKHIFDYENYVIYETRCAIISFDGLALEIYFDFGKSITEDFILYEGDDIKVIDDDPLKFEELGITI